MTVSDHAQWIAAWGAGMLSTAVFAPFAWAVRGHFHQQRRLPVGMGLLSAASLSAYICMFIILALHQRPPPTSCSAAALSVMALASALFWWAIATTRSRRLNLAHSGSLSDHVQSSGPYAWIRHPFYTAYVTFWIGTALLAGGWQWLPVAMLATWYVLVARGEERHFMRSAMSADYTVYRNHTGMFLPRPWRSRC